MRSIPRLVWIGCLAVVVIGCAAIPEASTPPERDSIIPESFHPHDVLLEELDERRDSRTARKLLDKLSNELMSSSSDMDSKRSRTAKLKKKLAKEKKKLAKVTPKKVAGAKKHKLSSREKKQLMKDAKKVVKPKKGKHATKKNKGKPATHVHIHLHLHPSSSGGGGGHSTGIPTHTGIPNRKHIIVRPRNPPHVGPLESNLIRAVRFNLAKNVKVIQLRVSAALRAANQLKIQAAKARLEEVRLRKEAAEQQARIRKLQADAARSIKVIQQGTDEARAGVRGHRSLRNPPRDYHHDDGEENYDDAPPQEEREEPLPRPRPIARAPVAYGAYGTSRSPLAAALRHANGISKGLAADIKQKRRL